METFAPCNGSHVTEQGCLPVDATSLANEFFLQMFYDELVDLNGHFMNTYFKRRSLAIVRPLGQTIVGRIKNLWGLKTSR